MPTRSMRRPARSYGYKHQLGPITTYCCGPNNRGVAVSEDKVHLRRSTPLVALDAKSETSCGGRTR